jgi:hypothetical protein
MNRHVHALSLVLLLLAGSCALAPATALTPARTARAATRPALPADLVVIKRFGAALRRTPSSAARIVRVMPCGQTLAVSGANQGWYRVYVGPYEGWVGGARVADAANPPPYDCTDAYTFQMGQHVYSYVRTGCLSLRVSPSRQAAYYHCVANFHAYTVINGPIAVAGEDWFAVTSSSTGSGWSLAQ